MTSGYDDDDYVEDSIYLYEEETARAKPPPHRSCGGNICKHLQGSDSTRVAFLLVVKASNLYGTL